MVVRLSMASGWTVGSRGVGIGARWRERERELLLLRLRWGRGATACGCAAVVWGGSIRSMHFSIMVETARSKAAESTVAPRLVATADAIPTASSLPKTRNASGVNVRVGGADDVATGADAGIGGASEC